MRIDDNPCTYGARKRRNAASCAFRPIQGFSRPSDGTAGIILFEEPRQSQRELILC